MFKPIKAPFIRPGVVISEALASGDDLLADFALDIRARGFTVAGCVRKNGRLFDLGRNQFADDGQTMVGLAAATFRAAMRDDADLVAVSDFPALAVAARRLLASIPQTGAGSGMPVVSAISGPEVQNWLDFAQAGGTMIAPRLAALWRWWGPDRLYDDLTLGVQPQPVRRIVCGPRWLMVHGAHGVGLSYLPKSAKDLLPRLKKLERQSLRDLAELSGSWDPLDMAVGVAAINAHYNRQDLDGMMGNGADQFSALDGRVVVVGAFPGLAETLNNPVVIETDPRPGEYPMVAMDALLPGCAAAVVASSSLVNRTLPRILRLAQGVPLALVGPVAPLSPRLHGYGAGIVGGLVVTDPDGLAAAILAGAPPKEFIRFGRYMHIRCGDRHGMAASDCHHADH